MRRTAVLAFAAAAFTTTATAQAPEQVGQGFLLYATPAGNIGVAIGQAGVFIVGPVSVASTATIQADLARRTQVAARYVVVTQQAAGHSEGDGGWARLGAFVAAHETTTGAMHREEARITSAGGAIPRIAFSEVLKFDLGGQDIHAVHQAPGNTYADLLVHFENAGVVYLGETLPGDGYPVIDTALGGTLDGFIETLRPWAGQGGNRFVGARGPAQRGTDVRAFRDMLVTMRDRVRALRQAGRTIEQVVAAHPSAEFDARFGHGRVTPDEFVREVYAAVRSR